MYIELYFLVNFVMNLIMLKLAAALTSCRVSALRLCLGAAAGGLYSIAAAYVPALLSMPVKLISGFLMAFTLPFCGVKQYLARVGAVYLAAFASGGLAVCIVYITGGGLGAPVPFAAALIAAALALFLPRAARQLVRRSAPGRGELVLLCGGREYRVPAMVDTGSSLMEPVSGKPVTVAPIEELKHLCVIPVPAQTVAGGAMLYAFKPESIAYIEKKRVELDSLVAVSTLPAVKAAIIPLAALPA